MEKHLLTLPIKEILYNMAVEYPAAEGPEIETNGRTASVYYGIDVPGAGYVYFDKVYDAKSKNPRYEYCISYDADFADTVNQWLKENLTKK
ncbi:hypothetical protein OFDDKENP_00152 [Aeromonas phage B614]|nr:hypothetical protein OFDDKENP_00152 [Aeromonas phage B614]UYD58120.1 hypothetical protein JNEOFJEA_00023 [Aeromonas phage UP87]UYD58484.1 hypothetical protein IPAKJDPM_00141 [Aeromonas phage avDM14-QBC]UYD58700.1 hypothetical protein HNNIDBEH_00107 [Aeromonas phage avDM10-HWA]UYD58997.1 hypothetical protein OFOPOMKI_00147 [Aeromonas phage avDM7-IJDJ]UYD59809.1 hypothetical protein LEHPIFIF_00036 [Aeromonas phage avDM9-HANS]